MFLFHRHQLVNGVEALLLDAGAGVKLLHGDEFGYFPVHAGGAGIPVGNRVPQHLSILIQQDEIHAPGVDAHGGRDLPQFLAAFHAVYDLCKEPFKIPAEMAVFFRNAVFKAVDLLQDDFPVLDGAQNVAAAGRADIHSQCIASFHHWFPLFCIQVFRVRKRYSVPTKRFRRFAVFMIQQKSPLCKVLNWQIFQPDLPQTWSFPAKEGKPVVKWENLC